MRKTKSITAVKMPPAGIAPLDEDMGPAMRLLGPESQRFVMEYLLVGGNIDLAETALVEAGALAPGKVSAKRQVMDMLRNTKVLSAIREEADKRMKAAAILGASVLVEIANDKFHKDRLKAATELLNRSGLVVEDVSRVIVEDSRSTEEIVKRVTALATKVGVDPRKLLGNVIDAEYVELDAGLPPAEDSFEAMMARSAPDA
jgi:hypothetical protein